MKPASRDSGHETPLRVPFIGLLRHRSDVEGVTVREMRDDSSIDVPPHQHDTAHFCFVMDPGYHSSARGADGTGVRFDLLYHPPETRHEDRYLRRGGRFLTVDLSSDWLERVGETCSLPSASLALRGPRCDLIRERLRFESRCTDSASPLVLEGLILELAALASTRAVVRGRRRAPWIRTAIEMIYDEPREDLTVARLAGEIGVHPVALARAFRRELNASPGEFLRWRRMEHALSRLRRLESPIVEIALEAGFADQPSFTRACRQMLGVTPGAYRARF